MGCTFAAALLKKTATAPAARKALREAMEALGYRKSPAAEASLVLPLHHDKKSAWMTLALEIPAHLDEQLELLRKLAAQMHTAILYFLNLDSDFLYVAATDGSAVQHVHVGFIDKDAPENADVMRNSDDLSVFDALLPDDDARAAFRRILAVDDEDRVFSEDAAQEMAALFGYTPEALFIAPDAEPFAVLAFNPAGQEAVPFLMPEDAPPQLHSQFLSWDNPSEFLIDSVGGAGKSLRIVLRAEGYDAYDWELPVLWLKNVFQKSNRAVEIPVDEKVVPVRCRFEDGADGWTADFPDVPISRGVNPASPAVTSPKALDYRTAHQYILYVPFTGGQLTVTKPAPLTPAEKLDPRLTEAWRQGWRDYREDDSDGKTHIWIMPLENPEQHWHGVILRRALRGGQWSRWLTPYLSEDNNI